MLGTPVIAPPLVDRIVGCGNQRDQLSQGSRNIKNSLFKGPVIWQLTLFK
jgi:hypothetical protein